MSRKDEIKVNKSTDHGWSTDTFTYLFLCSSNQQQFNLTLIEAASSKKVITMVSSPLAEKIFYSKPRPRLPISGM